MSLSDLINSGNPAPSWSNLRLKSLIVDEGLAPSGPISGDITFSGDLTFTGNALLYDSPTELHNGEVDFSNTVDFTAGTVNNVPRFNDGVLFQPYVLGARNDAYLFSGYELRFVQIPASSYNGCTVSGTCELYVEKIARTLNVTFITNNIGSIVKNGLSHDFIITFNAPEIAAMLSVINTFGTMAFDDNQGAFPILGRMAISRAVNNVILTFKSFTPIDDANGIMGSDSVCSFSTFALDAYD